MGKIEIIHDPRMDMLGLLLIQAGCGPAQAGATGPVRGEVQEYLSRAGAGHPVLERFRTLVCSASTATSLLTFFLRMTKPPTLCIDAAWARTEFPALDPSWLFGLATDLNDWHGSCGIAEVLKELETLTVTSRRELKAALSDMALPLAYHGVMGGCRLILSPLIQGPVRVVIPSRRQLHLHLIAGPRIGNDGAWTYPGATEWTRWMGESTESESRQLLEHTGAQAALTGAPRRNT